MIIYQVTNTVNGKRYIGQTRNTLEHRKNSHLVRVRNGTNRPLYNAIRKYGLSSFKWEKLETVKNLQQLDARETFYIKEANSLHPNGYNLMAVGNNGHSISQLTRDRMRKASSRPCSDSTKQKISDSLKHRYAQEGFSEERAKKISNTLKKTRVRRPSVHTIVAKHPEKGEFEYAYITDFCRDQAVSTAAAKRWLRGACKSKLGWKLERIPLCR